MLRRLVVLAVLALPLLLSSCARINVDDGARAENVGAGELAAYVAQDDATCSAEPLVCDCLRTSAIIGLTIEEATEACRTAAPHE